MERVPRRDRLTQLGLFCESVVAPQWRDLSDTTRAEAVSLLAQLLREARYLSPRLTAQEEPAMSEKIKPQHLTRKAILYVRQSTAYQVENNSELEELREYELDRALDALIR